MQKFFEQFSGVVGVALQWLDEERGIEAHEVQEMEVSGDFCLSDNIPLSSPYAPLLWYVVAAGWDLFIWDYHRNGNFEVYHTSTTEGYCHPDCHCSWCQVLREQNAVA